MNRRPRLLLLGPLRSIHVRRWAEIASEIGYRVYVAGDVDPEIDSVDFEGAAEEVIEAAATRPNGEALPSADERVEWLRRLASRISPDLIHAHWLRSWGFWATYGRFRPLVVTAWGSDVYLARGKAREAASYAIRNGPRLTAPSPALVSELVDRGASANDVELLQLGVDLEQFTPPTLEDRRRARLQLGLGSGPVVLSFRGGLPNYNLDVVVRAFDRLRPDLPDAQLVIAHGRTALSDEASRALEQSHFSDGIRVDGDVPHETMPAYFRSASVGVSIPGSDGGARSIWEAFACGLPVVVSDLPHLRDRFAELSAVRLAPIDEASVATALADLIGNRHLAESMSAEGPRWVAANADHRQMVDRLATIYAEEIERSDSGDGGVAIR